MYKSLLNLGVALTTMACSLILINPQFVSAKTTHHQSTKIKTNQQTDQPNQNGSLTPQSNWGNDTNRFNTQMPWETDGHGHDLIAPTTGANNNIIYYREVHDDYIHPYVKKAINAWNNLDVIKFQPAPNNTTEAITIGFDNDPNTNNRFNIAGITYYSYPTNNTANKFTTMTKEDIHIEPECLAFTFDQEIINVIEHELGHALGFNHDTEYLLNPNNNTQYTTGIMSTGIPDLNGKLKVGTIPLGVREKNMLEQHYQNQQTN